MWAFPGFSTPTVERFSAVPRSKPGFTDIYKKGSGAGGGKPGNPHIRRFPVSKAQGERIPHGAMPGKYFAEVLLNRFSQQFWFHFLPSNLKIRVV
jgi:hypothetical protein